MHIFHVLDHSLPLHSGYTFRTLSILREQRALGWQTSHLTSSKQESGDLLEEQVEDWSFYRTPDRGDLLSRLPVLNQWTAVTDLERRLLALAQDLQPDIIHAHSPALNGIAAIRVGRKLSIPVVYEMRASWEDAAVDHGTTTEGSLRYKISRGLETWVLKRADAITTISQGLKGDIARRGIAEEKITLVPNAVDAQHFQLAGEPDPELRAQLGLQDATVLGFLGSFYGYEGLSLLLEAMPILLKQNPDLRVLLVGGGLQDENLHQQAKNLGIEDKVIFTGRVPHSEVHCYYQQVDVLVYPRLSIRLTELVTPLKPLEAMAQGKLLVASNVGGHRELIDDGGTGVLFAAGSPDALADAVLNLLAHPEDWKHIRANGRRFVESERNWPASVAHYQSVYEQVLAKKPAG